MASGNYYGGVCSDHYRAYIYWSSTPDEANLKSTVTVTMKFWCDWRISVSAAKSWSITCNGTTKSGSYTSGLSGTGTWDITTQTFTVSHSNGVAKNITISGSFGVAATLSGTYYSSIPVSGTANLGTITQRMPSSPTTVNVSEGTVAQTNTAFTLSWSGASAGTFAISKYRIYYSVGNGWVHYKDVTGTSTSCNLSGIVSTRGNSASFSVATIDTNGNISSGRPNKSVTLAKLPTAPTTVSVSTGTVAQTTTAFTLSWSGASAGSGSISKYRIYYKTSSSASWTVLKDVTGTSASLSLSGIVSTRGNLAYFTVGTINSYSLVSATGGPSKTVTLAKIPTIPTSLNISNYNPKRNDTVSISWSGATAGSGSISNYYVDVRRYKNSAWSDWTNISSPTSASYDWSVISTYTDLSPNDIVQVRIGVRNSYELTAGTWIISGDITIKGGVIRLNVNGVWKEGIAYINVNGVWKEATSVYTNSNGVWKESL